MADSETKIPVVDFAAWCDGDGSEEEERKRVAREIDDAFRDVGFVYLKNHGVSGEMVRGCFEWVRIIYLILLLGHQSTMR